MTRRSFFALGAGLVGALIVASLMTGCLGVNLGPALECRAKGGSWQDNGDGTGFCRMPAKDCRDSGRECVAPLKCNADPNGAGLPWTCQLEPPPTTLPGPKDCRTTGCPTHGETCVEIAREVWKCVTPTPSPSPSPTPAPTPTPQPTPSPCLPTSGQVCVNGDGSIFPFDRTKCWTCKDWLGYMTRSRDTDGDGVPEPAQYAPGGSSDGDAHGHPGFWIHHTASGGIEKLVSKKDCTRPDNGLLQMDYPRAEPRVVPCPSPSPTPGPSPSPSVPPSPAPGVSCAPLSHVGVAFHAQHPAPNGPLGYRWIFSATPKSRKPFCPDKRNECEQQAYQGDPVNAYDSVVWRFDLRFQCQDPAGPLWNQQEPHTGSSWENTDVRQENAYMANLKPAVKGLHRVRTCRRDAPSVCEITEKVAN